MTESFAVYDKAACMQADCLGTISSCTKHYKSTERIKGFHVTFFCFVSTITDIFFSAV